MSSKNPYRVPYTLDQRKYQQVFYDARTNVFKTRIIRKCQQVNRYLFYYRYHCIAYIHKRRLWVVRDAANNPKRQFYTAGTWQACRNWIKTELAKKRRLLPPWAAKGR
jgi:hypothetical protein